MTLLPTPEDLARQRALEERYGRNPTRRQSITDAIIALFNGPQSPGMIELRGEPEMRPEPPRANTPAPDGGPSIPVTASSAQPGKKRGGR